MVSALRSSSTAALPTNGGPSLTLSIAKPSGTASGDILAVMFAQSSVSSNLGCSISGGSAWTTLTGSLPSQPGVAYNMFYKTAGGSEPSTYTITVGSAKQAMCAVAACWDATLLTPTVSTFTNNNSGGARDQDENVPAFTNSTAGRFGFMGFGGPAGVGPIYTHVRTSTLATGWTSIASTYSISKDPQGPGEDSAACSAELLECYDDDNFAAMTLVGEYVHNGFDTTTQCDFYELITDVGYLAPVVGSQGGTELMGTLPRRHARYDELPYDLRRIRLGRR